MEFFYLSHFTQPHILSEILMWKLHTMLAWGSNHRAAYLKEGINNMNNFEGINKMYIYDQTKLSNSGFHIPCVLYVYIIFIPRY